ncbi:MAG: Asp-tRNA(Asn)/Glu-tRNA(Gln) amidotransferase subunit GatB [Acidimicrobiia bacterium]
MSERNEAVIGLEVHTELSTATKLFCGCANEFGGEPNTRVCPVCLGLPGSLPVINEGAVELALRIGEVLHCRVPHQSLFARKNYFYPDMPKDFQISQYEEPICIDGWLDVDGERVGIERAHMEEDTGKTTHVGGGGRIHEAQHSLVDYNRAGVPLMEIVSRPDLRSAEQARTYVTELRALLQAIGASDVKMEEGSLRVDANVSLRATGTEPFGTKVEIKNMNSLRSLGRALGYEIDRQQDLLGSGGAVAQETRHWDEDDGRTHSLRSKEEAFDYRYFPEPDLVPLAPDDGLKARASASIPELPAARRARLVEKWRISAEDARVLVATPGLTDYAEAAVAALKDGTAADVVRWCTGGLMAYLHETGLSVEVLPLAPDGLAELVGLVADGTLSRNLAQDVLAECLREPRRPAQVVDERGLAQMSDESELGAIVERLVDQYPDEAASYRTGDEKARKKLRSFFMGQAMAATKGQGNPKVLTRLVEEHLG